MFGFEYKEKKMMTTIHARSFISDNYEIDYDDVVWDENLSKKYGIKVPRIMENWGYAFYVSTHVFAKTPTSDWTEVEIKDKGPTYYIGWEYTIEDIRFMHSTKQRDYNILISNMEDRGLKSVISTCQGYIKPIENYVVLKDERWRI